jgi:hypothetical protein
MGHRARNKVVHGENMPQAISSKDHAKELALSLRSTESLIQYRDSLQSQINALKPVRTERPDDSDFFDWNAEDTDLNKKIGDLNMVLMLVLNELRSRHHARRVAAYQESISGVGL